MTKLHLEDDHEVETVQHSEAVPAQDGDTVPVSFPFPSIASRAEQLQELLLLLQEPIPTLDEPVRQRIAPNQRQYSRCPITQDRTTGILTINGRRYDCRLVEMSIGGFGVVLDRHLKMSTGTVGELRAPGLSYVVEVTRFEARPGGMYLGLRQLDEIVDQSQFRLSRQLPAINFLIASIAGALIAVTTILFMGGK